MCCGMHVPMYVVAPRPAGWIKTGETSLDAGDRRYRERQKLAPAEGKLLNGPTSETSTLASLPPKEVTLRRAFRERTTRSPLSMGDRDHVVRSVTGGVNSSVCACVERDLLVSKSTTLYNS